MSDYADQSPEYLYSTAVSYLKGDGVPADSKKAAELMAIAAEKDYLPAVRDLGVLYLNGDGVPADAQKAYELINIAAAKMDPNAIYHLSLMYENGIGVKKDLYQALKLMAYCAAANYTGAVEDADRIEDEIDRQREKNLNARPLVCLDISEYDVEACCCKKMFDAVKEKDIYVDMTYEGPAVFGADEQGNEIVLKECPFCHVKPRVVPHDKVY
ncbi:MAG: sel1 repeat family protein [archaeon]|nr:sel1 repeat family protein [archaeon]